MRCLCLLIVCFGFVNHAHGQCDESRTPSPLGATGKFGAALAADGNDMIVGVPGHDAVQFYRRSGAVWSVAGAPVTGAAATGYGNSVAIAGGVAFVGLPLRDSAGQVDSGAVQVFTSSAPGIWNPAGIFNAPSPFAGGRFGHDIDTDGVRVIVGEPGFNGAKGRFHIFTIGAGGSVTLEQSQSSPSVSAGAQLGYSVAIDGDAAAAGAPYHDGALTDVGLGVFYRRGPAGFWAQKATWTFVGGIQNAGWSIDVEGVFGVVGAPGIGGALSGHIFVRWDGQAYVEDSWYADGDGTETGYSVALDGNRAIIGAPADDSHFSGSSNVGSFDLFEHDGTKFVYRNGRDAFPLATPTLRFGESCALVGSDAILGAPLDSTAGTDAGAFFEFDASTSAWHFGSYALTSSPGSNGTPTMVLEGSFCRSDPFWFGVGNCEPNRPIILVVGLQYAPVTLLGGTLGPTPDLFVTGFSTNASGTLAFLATMPPATPAGLDLYIQAWIIDSLAPFGYARTRTYYFTTAF